MATNESFNIATHERLTLYDFGLKVAEVWGLDADLIESVNSDHFQGMARRPVDTSYDLRKLDGMGFELSDVEDGLKLMKKEKN